MLAIKWRNVGEITLLKSRNFAAYFFTLIMDITTIIGFSAAALLLFQKQSDSVDKLQEQLDQLKEDQKEDIEDVTNKINDIDTSNGDYVKKYVTVTPSLQFSNLNGKNWIGRFSWEFKNNSKDKTFTITGVVSTFTLCGYTCQLFIPGNDDQFMTLSPGKSAVLNSTFQDKKWYNDSNTRKVIKNELKEYKGKNVSGKMIATITVRAQSQIQGTSPVYFTLENVQGDVGLTKGLHYYKKEGENFVNKSL